MGRKVNTPQPKLGDPCKVYLLASSEDMVVRYIGQTIGPVAHRFAKHLEAARRGGETRKERWMRSVMAEGFEVVVYGIIEDARWCETEQEAIAVWKALGFDLVNLTPGGEGLCDPTGEIFARRAKSLQAFWDDPVRSAAARAKISAKNKGRVLTSEHVAKTRAASVGLKRSEETRRRLSEAHLGYKKTPQQILNEQRAAFQKTGLTVEDLDKIRQLRSQGWRHKAIAALYPQNTYTQVAAIATGQTFKAFTNKPILADAGSTAAI